jgi:predicted metal-dependent hydrolase
MMSERLVIESIPVEVRRSKRRRTRIGLAFDPGGYVIMEAPLDASQAEIQSVVTEHHRWLRYRLEKVAASMAVSAVLSYTSGELLHYLGQAFELVIRAGSRDRVMIVRRQARQLPLFECGVQGEIRVTVGPPDIRSGKHMSRTLADGVRDAINVWYLQRADVEFARHLEWWRQRLPWLGGRIPEWRHRFMRSQWGSCSVAGRISLNTHLVKTPDRLIEYVVLHELCHLRHHDHGRRFYGLMARHMEDWQDRRAELNRYLPVLLQD